MSDLVSEKILLINHPYRKVKKYRSRLDQLDYKYFCYIKRDGNCFYNSFSAAYFAKITKNSKEYLVKIQTKMEKVMENIKNMNENLMVFECFYETFLESFELQMNNVNDENSNESEKRNNDINNTKSYNGTDKPDNNIQKNNISPTDDKETETQLERELIGYNDFIWDNPTKNNLSFNEFVGFYKVLISLHLKSNKELYEPFIGDVIEYAKKRVEPFYVDASEVEINILSEVLEIGIKIVYINQDFEQIFGDKNNFITLLYTPSHFEPLLP